MDFDFGKAFDYENGFYLTGDPSRLAKLICHLDVYRATMEVPGALVECGVFKGASLMRFLKMREVLQNPTARKIVGFDVFGEFPAATTDGDRLIRNRFIAEAGSEGPSKDELQTYVDGCGVGENAELIAGDVCETVPAYLEANPQLRLSLLHVDVDLYEPTLACLTHLAPRVSRGGIILLDDYSAFPGANQAIEEYFAGAPGRLRKFPYAPVLAFTVVE